MSAQARRWAFRVVAATVVVGAVFAYGLYRYALGYPDRPAEVPGRAVTLTIRRGTVFPRVLEALRAQGLIGSPLAFRLYANYRGLAARVRAGEYALQTSISPRALLDALVKGVPDPTVAVTIPEGRNILEVARLLADAQIAPYEGLVAAMRDPAFLRRQGINGDSVEGYLFPDTYQLRASTPPMRVLEQMVRHHQEVFQSLRSENAARTRQLRKQLGWSQYEIVTLASIVEKETGLASERPLIAGVFFNRLLLSSFEPKLLQTDPTIVYGCTVPDDKSAACQRFAGRIQRIHLDDRDNAYSTYAHPGLPPGPICNPGRAALEAVFRPTHSRFLYFVSKNDGSHFFSATPAEHESAVDLYQRGR